MLKSPRIQTALTLAVLVSLRPVASGGQDLPDADTREVMSFALTEGGFVKYTQASRNLLPLMQRMPSECQDEDAPRSLGELAARMDAVPGIKAAITSAGMTTREYVVFSWSLLTSGIVAWTMDQPGAKAPTGTAKANVDFVKKHQAEIQKLEVLSKFGDCDDGENEGDSASDEE